jgi:hypothetical protein
MGKTKIFFLLPFLFTINNLAQENKISFEFLPSGLNFMPLKANVQEARLGILYFPSDKSLRADIGNSVDLVKLNIPDDNIFLASGIEFMGYALSKNYEQYRLQIDALDGLFGGNITLKKLYEKSNLYLRLRIVHNSAHLVDGHYDFIKNMWIDSSRSNYFTRNFYEITVAHQLNTGFGYFKYYGGFSHSFFVRPAKIERINLHAGFELAFENLIGKVFKKDENIFIANYFYLAGIGKYVGSQQTVLGIKFGGWEEKGLTFYLAYSTGLDYFDAFFGQRLSRFGIGFNIDFL